MASSSVASGTASQCRTEGSSQVKCSYPDCYRYFANDKAMKAHKKREPEHEYCSRCDVDCEDDSELLIHMIESGRHVVCPMCGLEFKSSGGLESHIAQAHQHTQNLKCIGCEEAFTRAAGLMRHIEIGECEMITPEVFERRLVEDAIIKDAWQAQLKPDKAIVPRGPITSFDPDNHNEQAGVSLLDSDSSLMAGTSTKSGNDNRDHLTASVNNLSLGKEFPALVSIDPNTYSRNLDSHKGPHVDQKAECDHMSLASHGNSVENRQTAWKTSSTAANRLFSPIQLSSHQGQKVDPSHGTSVPVQGLSIETTKHIRTKPAPISPPSRLDPMDCFQSMINKFECPGRDCGRTFDTIEAFNDHLVGPDHKGGPNICPSCLGRFKSTMALVAHCESPSKRCTIRKSPNYDKLLREITAGIIGAEGHHIDGSVRYVANDISKSASFW